MHTLLSFANGALQYSRGKQTGLSGLIGIAIAILAAYQWDHLVPIFEAIGIVGFLDRHGLIFEGEGGLTGFVIFMMLFRATILFCVLGTLVIILGIIISMIFSSKIGLLIMSPFLVVIFAPFMIIKGIYDHFFIPEFVKEEQKKERRKEWLKEHKKVEDVINDDSEEITAEQARNRLNRLPTKGDSMFIVGLTEQNEVYMLLPRPDNLDDGKFKIGDLAGVKYNVTKFYRRKNERPGMLDPVEIKMVVEDRYDVIQAIHSEKIVKYYLPTQIDVKRECSQYTVRGFFYDYIRDVQGYYFKRKETLLRLISNANDKDEFERLVKRVTLLNATNEDIVRMMLDSERQVQ